MIDDNQLISAVSSKPDLYDRFSAGYKNHQIKLLHWKRVADELSNGLDSAEPISLKILIGRWHCLRERYTREVRKIEKRGSLAYSNWPYFTTMSFLHPLLRKKKTYNEDNSHFSPDISRSPTPDSLTLNAKEQHIPVTKELEKCEALPDSKSPKKRERKHEKRRSEKYLCNPDYLIGKSVESVLKSVKNLPLSIEFRRKFRNLISECEEQILNSSMQNNI